MDEQTAAKIALYKEFNNSISEFKNQNFRTNRFYIAILIVILLIILIAKQIFIAGSLVFTFIFSFFGLCIAIMWVISQDAYSYLVHIKLAEVLEKMECEFPVKPYTLEHEAIGEYKKNHHTLSYDSMQKVLAFVVAAIFTVLFFAELAPFYLMMKSLLLLN